MPSGYSGTPTAKKLGIKPGHTVIVLGAPAEYGRLIGGVPAGVALRSSLRDKADIVHVFVTRELYLAKRIAGMREAIEPAGAIWVSWPKRASKVTTDLTEDVIRDLALRSRLVDVKVCAVDETWSGLKLVIPVSERRRRRSSRD